MALGVGSSAKTDPKFLPLLDVLKARLFPLTQHRHRSLTPMA
jgi:hypothetical protein